jgi:hypothetical protein
MTKAIPWNTGDGNIIVTFSGHGDGVVTVTSDTDCTLQDRQQVLTISGGGLTATVLVIQKSGARGLITSDGKLLTVLGVGADRNALCAKAETGVRLTAEKAGSERYQFITKDGKLLAVEHVTNNE